MTVRLTAPVVLPCDAECSVLRDAVVDIDADGRIAWVGSRGDAPPSEAPVRALSGALLPGLINTHAHTPMITLRGLGGDLPLLRWLQEVMWPAESRLRADDVRAGMTAGCVELLRTGCTTSVEMYFFTDAMIDAVTTVGSRAVLTPGILAVPGWDRLGPWERMRDDISERIDAVGVRSGPGERIELGYGPHAAYTLPPEALASVGEHARARDALVHIHVAEAAEEDLAQRSCPTTTSPCWLSAARRLPTAPARTPSSPPGSRGWPRCAGRACASGSARMAQRPATISTCGPKPGWPGFWPGSAAGTPPRSRPPSSC
jgi:5-methylthioadenosine/S-adenosylhomocysteine deaminase